jgi:ABC-type Fe3+/spermidine/putrescine transport system ATPase subunit
VTAVDGVSLDIQKGSLVTLLGPSGCGKTTTLRLIGGFEFPTAGRIWLTGRRSPPWRRTSGGWPWCSRATPSSPT